jgi:hypothetical protein
MSWKTWFFPEQITVPTCVRQLLEFVYPTVDWDQVTFHNDWKHVLKLGNKGAITLPDTFKPNRIRVYFKPGRWNPCSCDGLGLIVHEGFHVLQIQELAWGYRLGLAGPTTMLYLACWASNGFSYPDHPAEKDAYAVAGKPTSLFETCCAGSGLPCDCDCDPPTLDMAGLDDLKMRCDKLPQTSSGMKFWEQLWECTPGLQALIDAAKWVWDHTCDSDLSWGIRWLPCAFGALIAGIIWAIAIAWFIVWFVIALIATVVVWLVTGIIEIVGGIGTGIGAVLGGIWGAISSPFSSAKSWLWYTTSDGTTWQIPDEPITKDDRSRSSHGPSLAVYQSNVYAAYRASDNSDLWYNVFDGNAWLAPDIKITTNGRTRTSVAPSLAAYDGRLYMAYRAAQSGSTTNNDLWYNVFDGNDWLDPDTKITTNGRTRSSRSPSLAVYNGLLYMAYRASDSDDLWYNVFDGNAWLDPDIKITKNGRTRTSQAPSLAVYDGLLYMAYRASDSDDLWYNVFNGNDWLDPDIKITKNDKTRTSSSPSLCAFDSRLFMVYKGADSSDLWYNVFDGNDWRDEDCRITKDDHVKSARGPSLVEFPAPTPYLILAYRDDS